MQCLFKYPWVKLPRSVLPEGQGLMASWARLAARAAFRKGTATYCGFANPVTPGMWSGGVVGLKSILRIRNRGRALAMLDMLSSSGFVDFTLDPDTKKLDYKLRDWVVSCSGEESPEGNVYTTDGYGFVCVPRTLTERLVDRSYTFEDSDAWLDLWCHTVFQDPRNAFSFLAPACQYGKYGAILTLETLGQRWGWSKAKVWRFMQRHEDVFSLYRLPGSFGCLIFNKLYPTDTEVSLPRMEEILRIIGEIRIYAENTHKRGTVHAHMSRMVAWFSRRYLLNHGFLTPEKIRVSLPYYIYCAYFSLCRNWKNCKYDCRSCNRAPVENLSTNEIRGPCSPVDLNMFAKEFFTYEYV